jgi:hypothetical protein
MPRRIAPRWNATAAAGQSLKEYGERDQNQSHVVNLSEESRVPSYAKQRCRTVQF